MERHEVKELHEKLQSKLNLISEELGFHLKLGSGTFGATAVFKLECSPLNEEGRHESQAMADFKLLCSRYGLKPGHLDTSFRDGGRMYTIRGIKVNSYKYPILVERDDGKMFKFPADRVNMHLAAAQPPAKPDPGMEKVLLKELQQIYLDLEPENLTCDGEIRDLNVVVRRRKALEARRDALILKLGRTPAEEEIWGKG